MSERDADGLSQLGQGKTSPSEEIERFAAPPGPFVDRYETEEFTALCPKTGQPDFATLRLWYAPEAWCVELKSFKLYLWSWRDRGAFHERVVNTIADRLVAVAEPRWLLLEGEFKVRGGVYTTTLATRGPVPEGLLTARLNRAVR